MNNRYILIGGAWPYANNSLHLGHLAALISGDILARYHRQIGDNVIYVSGTDCHGTPITERAKKEGVNPYEISEKYHNEFEKVFKDMNFSYDLYNKTEDEYHKEKVKEIFKKIYDNGYIYEKIDDDNFCKKCNKFVADREVKLICPKCGEETKGDQCDCGYVPTKEDIINAICIECGTNVTIKKNKNLYLALSKLQESIEYYVKKNEGNWRKNAINETHKYMKQGLKDRAVTRNLDWGIEIPIAGFDDKRVYVWIDAVLGYLTASMKYCENNGLEWKKWWYANENTKMYMVHGKDNITFHTLILPGLLIGLDKKLKLPDRIVSTEYLNYDGQKFSKSKGIGKTILDALQTYNSDTLRFYLLKSGPENKDTNFTEEEYHAVHNEINNKLGNFVNRTLKYKGLSKILIGKIDNNVKTEIIKMYNDISLLIEKCEFKSTTMRIIDFLDYANKYYDDKKPWIQMKENVGEFNNTIYNCAVLIANISNLIEPIMPNAASKIRDYMNIDNATWEYIEINKEIELINITPIFEKIN